MIAERYSCLILRTDVENTDTLATTLQTVGAVYEAVNESQLQRYRNHRDTKLCLCGYTQFQFVQMSTLSRGRGPSILYGEII